MSVAYHVLPCMAAEVLMDEIEGRCMRAIDVDTIGSISDDESVRQNAPKEDVRPG